jgi:hypothetical protein
VSLLVFTKSSWLTNASTARAGTPILEMLKKFEVDGTFRQVADPGPQRKRAKPLSNVVRPTIHQATMDDVEYRQGILDQDEGHSMHFVAIGDSNFPPEDGAKSTSPQSDSIPQAESSPIDSISRDNGVLVLCRGYR